MMPGAVLSGMQSSRTGPLRALWRGVLDLLFPPRCVTCGQGGTWFCATCRARIVPLEPPCCSRCSKPLQHLGLCRDCRERHRAFDGIRSVGVYAEPLRTAIRKLKFDGVQVAAEPLAALMYAEWQQSPLPVSLVVPVPAHPSRVRERGYNQAALLAAPLAERIGLPMSEAALRRIRATEKQIVLTAADRWQNVRDAFEADAALVRGRAILLVDDICTTAATLEYAAAALKAAGAPAVWGFTLARTCLPPADRAGPLPDHPAAPPVDLMREEP